MSFQTVVAGIFLGLVLWLTWVAFHSLRQGDKGAGSWIIMGIISSLMLGHCSYQGTTPEHLAEVKAEERAAQAADAARRKPRLYSKGENGCDVYTFYANDRNQFFTKCPGSVTNTETTWEHCTGVAGKGRRCEIKSQAIEAVNP